MQWLVQLAGDGSARDLQEAVGAPHEGQYSHLCAAAWQTAVELTACQEAKPEISSKGTSAAAQGASISSEAGSHPAVYEIWPGTWAAVTAGHPYPAFGCAGMH